MGNSIDLEKKSSAVTLSDMEVFIFPELIYSLVLANIMSPRIWRWRDDPWFAGLERMKPYRRIQRLKQYIIDHYTFNLDLDTWGLTTKETELARFGEFIDHETLAQSNALFGYEGDRYYFSIDIRTHFGLDKYEGHIIPYWKTETVEAMDAFCYKPDYAIGAGECVSLSTLYAAALFVVARIPLNDIYLMATPLHSQNFIDIDNGILTNNRRLVTRNMWFNGTELSEQARRALENERVTIVAHESGFIHAVYDEATISVEAYEHFSKTLKAYLKAELTVELLGNFLRNSSQLQKCFQMRWPCHGRDTYVGLERVFAYEHCSPYRITDSTREKLINDVDCQEFRRTPLPSRIVLNDLESFIDERKTNIDDPGDIRDLKAQFASSCLSAEIAIESLIRFCRVKPRLPDAGNKRFIKQHEPLCLDLDMTREEVIDRLDSIRDANEMADMAFYAYRDLGRTEPEPFLIAAVQRNPVSIDGSREMDISDLVTRLNDMSGESIYDDLNRVARPDEVWNYARGDGLEKALVLANIMRSRAPMEPMSLEISDKCARLHTESGLYAFASSKKLDTATWSIPVDYRQHNG